VVDLTTLRTISKIETGESPDAIAYDGKRGDLYVFNHKGNSATVIDRRRRRCGRRFRSAALPNSG
jgi:DNA-binding beta-propeller fold protein YncE